MSWLPGTVILLMAAREPDFQKRFTGLNVGHLADDWDPRIALGERVTVYALVARVLVAPWRRAFARRDRRQGIVE